MDHGSLKGGGRGLGENNIVGRNGGRGGGYVPSSPSLSASPIKGSTEVIKCTIFYYVIDLELDQRYKPRLSKSLVRTDHGTFNI